jgi:hypothetical protein
MLIVAEIALEDYYKLRSRSFDLYFKGTTNRAHILKKEG